MEQVWAFGWLVNQLLTRPPTTFTLVGTWAIAGPYLLALIGVPFTLGRTIGSITMTDLLVGSVSLVFALGYGALAFRITLAYARNRNSRKAGDHRQSV